MIFGRFTKFGTAVTGVLLLLLLDVGKLVAGETIDDLLNVFAILVFVVFAVVVPSPQQLPCIFHLLIN